MGEGERRRVRTLSRWRRPRGLVAGAAPARLIIARPLLGVVTTGRVEALLRGRRGRAHLSREAIDLRLVATDVYVPAEVVGVAPLAALVVAARVVIVRVYSL